MPNHNNSFYGGCKMAYSNTQIERVVNNETGEVINERKKKVVCKRTEEPRYVKFYFKAWCAFKNIKGVNMHFLCALLPYMGYAGIDGQRIYLNSILKRDIAKKLEWREKSALSRFNNELAKLSKAGIVKNVGRDTYQVNPKLVGRGSWADIEDQIALFHINNGDVSFMTLKEFADWQDMQNIDLIDSDAI